MPRRHLSFGLLALLLLHLEQQCSVDVWENTTKGDGGADQRVELFVAADRKLQVAGGDALHFEVFGRVAGKLEDFGGQILEDGSEVYGGLSADASLLAGYAAQVTLYATAGELVGGRMSARCNAPNRIGTRHCDQRAPAHEDAREEIDIPAGRLWRSVDLETFWPGSALPPVLPPVLPAEWWSVGVGGRVVVREYR